MTKTHRRIKTKMLLGNALLLFLSSFFCTLKAQDLDDSAIKTAMDAEFVKAGEFLYSNLDSTYFYVDRMIEIARSNNLIDAEISANMWKVSCAGYHNRIELLGESVHHLGNLITDNLVYLDSLEPEKESRVLFLTQKGNYYYKIGALNEAEETFNETIRLLKSLENPSLRNLKVLSSTYNFLGALESMRGNYQQAAELYTYGLQYRAKFDQVSKTTSPYIAFKLLADAYVSLKQYDKAGSYYRKTIDAYLLAYAEGKSSVSNSLKSCYNAYAKLFLKQNQYDSATICLNESLKYHKENDPFFVETYTLFAKASAPSRGGTTLGYFEKARNIGLENYGPHHYKIAEVNLAEGDYLMQENKKKAALEKYHKALRNLLSEFQDSSVYSLPILQNLRAKKVLLTTLQAKTQTLYALSKSEQKPELLENAFENALLAIQVIDSLRLDFDSEDSRQYLLENSYPVFELSLDICFDLYRQNKTSTYLTEAFRIAEKSKALVLLDALKNAQAQSYAGIPDDLLEKGRQIRFNSNRLQGKLDKVKNDAEKRTKLKNEIFLQEQAYSQFVKQLEAEHPKYYQSKYDLSTISIAEIQRELLPNNGTGLLEFFVGDRYLYRFLIKKGTAEWTKIPLDFPLKDWVSKFRKSIIGGAKNPTESAIDYTVYAHKLYEKLLGGMRLPKNIVLIPEGVLGYLPFDALLTSPVAETQARAFSNHDYFIRKHTVSYSYSATLLKEMGANKATTQRSFLGFAPSFVNFSPLDSSKQVTKRWAEKYQGDFWEGSLASRQNFIEGATGYDIIHVSSHAVANDSLRDACYLVCYDTGDSTNFLLYNRDLYNLSLSANLVVLGACETGSGQLQRGEGIISLARGFSYAGASSLLTTLWSVDEAKTAHLFDLFYKRLQMKETTELALVHAKREYLKAQTAHVNAHPRYWASLIPIGNMQAVNPVGTNEYWWFALLLVVAAMGYLLRLNRRVKA